MKIPVIKKILREDLKDAPSWVNSIIEPINQFMEQVYQSLNNNITYRENVQCFVKEITYTTPSTYPTMDNVEFQNELKVKATGVQIQQIVERTTYTPPAGPCFVPWVEDNGAIIISPITGLQASKSYTVRLLVT